MSDDVVYSGFVKRSRVKRGVKQFDGPWSNWKYEQGNSSSVAPMVYSKKSKVPMHFFQKEGLWSYENEYSGHVTTGEIEILPVNIVVVRE